MYYVSCVSSSNTLPFVHMVTMPVSPYMFNVCIYDAEGKAPVPVVHGVFILTDLLNVRKPMSAWVQVLVLCSGSPATADGF